MTEGVTQDADTHCIHSLKLCNAAALQMATVKVVAKELLLIQFFSLDVLLATDTVLADECH